MSIFEAALRGGALAILLFLAALLVRDARRLPAGLLGSLYALGVGAYVVVSAPGVPPSGWLMPLWIAAVGNPVVFWLLSATLFDDAFKLRWYHGAAWVGLVALGLACFLSSEPLLHAAQSLLALAAIGLGAWHALSGRRGDLVEGRRHLRVVLVVAAALHGAATIVAGLIMGDAAIHGALVAADTIGLLAITFAFAFNLLSVTPDGALITLLARKPSRAAAVIRGAPRHVVVDPPTTNGDAEQLAALDRLMQDERVYRQEGLSIANLAGRLDLPEYRLRRLINQRLGYRNFNAFLNDHRLADVMAALADPDQAEVPILTIALDAGFQSLGPFNRAFRDRTGMTPTEFRRQQSNEPRALAAE